MGTWRKHPFTVGRRYVALESFKSFENSAFQAGSEYELRQIQYGRYDGCSVFIFAELGGEALPSWWWNDDEPDDLCTKRFRECS